MTGEETPATSIKICGIGDRESMAAAVDCRVERIGLVFFPKSPRHVNTRTASRLASVARGTSSVVALTVDADDELICEIVAGVCPDELQLHGDESPARVAEVKTRFKLPVIKAIKLGGPSDLYKAAKYRDVADHILFDAKPPDDRLALPGGNGIAFDWRLLLDIPASQPYILSGGLDASNVGEAIRLTRAQAVDVSSGVESAPGHKSPEYIRRFVAAVRQRRAGDDATENRAHA